MPTNSPRPPGNATPAARPAASSLAASFTTLPDPSRPWVNRFVSWTALSNSHGQMARNSAATTVRAKPSSAANPLSPPPANPAAQKRSVEIVATAPKSPPPIATTVLSN